MKVLFMMKHPGSARNFDSLLATLAERGHRIHLAFEGIDERNAGPLIKRLEREFPSVTHGRAPKGGGHIFGALAKTVRLSLDYLRYLHPRYASATGLRARAAGQAPRQLVRLTSRPLVRSRIGIWLVRRLLLIAERALPVPADVLAYLKKSDPDVVLLTPLVGLGSRQADHLRAAKRAGLRTCYCVHSWDNLTNKGLLRDIPDLVTVWNEQQAREAVELHGVPRNRLAVAGASSYDHWFDWRVSRTREEFCAEVGLDPEKPFVLYVCSSPFVAPNEVAFVRRWIGEFRKANDGRLRNVGVLVRPHPQHFEQWRKADMKKFDNVAVWPAKGRDPIDEASRNEYFDSIYHAGAVFGINTSALIESGIVGRSVFTLLAEDFKETQEGTLHFHYLAEANGLLHVAGTVEESARQIAEALDRPEPDERSWRFVESFLRPGGLDTPATPATADAIQALAAQPAPKPSRGPLLGGVTRFLLAPLARRARARRVAASAAATAASEAMEHEKRKESKDDDGAPTRAAANGAAPPALQHVKAARRAAKQLSEAPGRVIAGPWLAEVGYELLYWIPYLTWASHTNQGFSKRLVILSRGGTAQWYQHLTTRYADVFDFVTPEQLAELRAATVDETRGYRKQLVVTGYEQELVAQVTASLELEAPHVLHPSMMFQAYSQLVKQSSIHDRPEIFEYRPMRQPELGPLEGELPSDYVVVRFYFNASFPDNEENRAFVASTIDALSARSNVLLLNTSLRIDDHLDADAHSDRIWRIDHLMTPSNNLELQTIAVSRARAFVGTYGGLSYLPPFLGVPSLAFYSDHTHFKQHHLEIAQRVFRKPEFGDFVVLDRKHVDLLNLASIGVLAS